MSFSYLDPESVFDAFKQSDKYMRPLFEPLGEYERIARNKPHPGIDKAYPKVTDGTTASVIEKTPRRILQQIPTGLVTSVTDDWLTQVANFKLTQQIIPQANDQFPFLQKAQMAISKSLTYGAQPAFFYFTRHGKKFGPDMKLPYIKDVFLEPGKVSDVDSNFIFMRAWYQPKDIEAIIANGKKLADKGVETGWDLSALSDIKDQQSQKDDLSTTPNERDKNNRSGGIEIVHCFQRGIGGTFYSIHMKTKKIVRTWDNKDPRGEIPIHYLYATADVSNPIGRGFVEMVGSMQNLMDAEIQMYQYNRALMLNPPMVKRGNWNKNQAKLAPNVLVDLGSDQSAAWEPVKIDSSALAQFSQNYSLMQSQMYQLLSAPTSNVSASTGNTQMSKTAQGVKQADSNLNVDDTFIRNQVEAWLSKGFATMLNIDFAYRTGVEEVQLDPDTANDIRNLPTYKEGTVSDDGKIRIDYNTETESLDFIVDAGSSEIEDDTEQIQQLKEIIADVNTNPYSIQYIQQAGKTLQLGEVYKQLFTRLKLKELDKILTDVPKDAEGKPQTPPPMAMDKPKLVINYDDVKSPTVKAALLQNAGIQADPQDIAQSDQMAAQLQAQAKASTEPQPDPTDPTNHPLIKLMSSLQIKFTDLPEDSKHELLTAIGLPSQLQSPVQQDTAIKAIQTAHTINASSQEQLSQQGQMAQDTPGEQSETPSQESAEPAQEQQQEQSQGTEVDQPSSRLTAQDQAYLQELLKMGLSEQQAGQALALIHHGYAPEDVIKMLGVTHG